MTKINITQLFTIFILSMGLTNHVIVIPFLINAAGRDAWISVIIGYILTLLFSLLLLYVTRKFQSVSIFEWISSTYSRLLSRVIAFLLFIYLTITGFITLKETVLWINETFLFNTPVVVVSLFILTASIYISYGKINVIAICAGVVLPFVIIFGLFVAIGTIPDKNFTLITPVLVENGWKEVIHGSLFAFGSAIELILLIFLQHRVDRELKFLHILLLIIFLSILTVGPLLDSISTFGVEEAGKLRYPAFFQWRILGIGNYFNHLDFFSIYQWLSGAFIHISMILYMITLPFDIKKKKQRFYIQAFICVIYLIVITLPISNEEFFTFLSRFYYIGSIFFGVFITVFIAFLIKTSTNRVSTNEKG
ncbi:GerAB/ArcD/ProY family transporter [Robertmurraya andreesenii]|uniref:Spore germination protein (Amino acid permease) n=1 Tax=Anoxybacillus andreesenii TaxID=1325932 RepID=A0ABT9VAH7_9BACL|nr:endospore germination permease [Robertmurraya andreesenii]MDQ0157958.1 spore germination protein (amino acid permease) [Robertmurraya andreesenii]